MAELDEFIHKYFEDNIKNNKTVLECIDQGNDGQYCIENFGEEDLKEYLKKYYQNNQLDDDTIVAAHAVIKQVTELFNALKVIKEAAKSDSVKDFCDNHFDTLSSDEEALKTWKQSAFKDTDTEQKIVSMIYAIMKYYKENGTTN